MTKGERIRQVLEGKQADRIPFSIWFHFGTEHLPGRQTAAIHADFFRAYDLDWLKVMSDYRYPMPEGMAEVASSDDLRRFGRFPMESEPFARQLAALREIRHSLGEDVPFVETVFSPFGVARRTLRSRLRRVWKEDLPLFKTFLASIADTLRTYVHAVARTGAAGIFYSVNGIAGREVSRDAFYEWVLPFDLEVLGAAQDEAKEGRFYFNVVHLHGDRLLWRPVMDRYPAHCFNWSVHHSPPSFVQARNFTRCALMGGLDERDISQRVPSEVAEQVRRAIDQAGPGGFLVAPGCAVPTDTPADLIVAARDACRGQPTPGRSWRHGP